MSAIICDENDNVHYTENIAQNSASGTQTVNIRQDCRRNYT